jgi:PhoPQ-activated pathogenicity-related protein
VVANEVPRSFHAGLLAIVFLSTVSAHSQEQTALDRYVAAPDASYRYQLLNRVAGDGYTAYVLEMTSQRWRTAEEVDRPIWKHWLTIVRPEHLETSTSLLIASGGSNEKSPPQVNPVLAQIAVTTNSVVSEIRMVPNQPLVFADDGNKRKYRAAWVPRSPTQDCRRPSRSRAGRLPALPLHAL